MSITFTEEQREEVPANLVVVDTTGDGHVFWLERLPGEQCRFAWDGVAGEPFTLIPQRSGRPFVWSPDRHHVAYYGVRHGISDRVFGPRPEDRASKTPSGSALRARTLRTAPAGRDIAVGIDNARRQDT
jgi:hypothetical protein